MLGALCHPINETMYGNFGAENLAKATVDFKLFISKILVVDIFQVLL